VQVNYSYLRPSGGCFHIARNRVLRLQIRPQSCGVKGGGAISASVGSRCGTSAKVSRGGRDKVIPNYVLLVLHILCDIVCDFAVFYISSPFHGTLSVLYKDVRLLRAVLMMNMITFHFEDVVDSVLWGSFGI